MSETPESYTELLHINEAFSFSNISCGCCILLCNENLAHKVHGYRSADNDTLVIISWDVVTQRHHWMSELCTRCRRMPTSQGKKQNKTRCLMLHSSRKRQPGDKVQ